jgi:hypothetical protein
MQPRPDRAVSPASLVKKKAPVRSPAQALFTLEALKNQAWALL